MAQATTKRAKTSEYYRRKLSSGEITLADVPDEELTEGLCEEAVRSKGQNVYALSQVPSRYRTVEMCLLAVEAKGGSLRYVPQRLRTEAVCQAAIMQDSGNLKWVPREVLTIEMCKKAFRGHPDATVSENLRYVPKDIRHSESFESYLLNAHRM